MGIKNCFVFSLNNVTYFVDKNIVDQKYQKYAQEKLKRSIDEITEGNDGNIFEKKDENAKIEMDEQFLSKLIECSAIREDIVVDTGDITILNDITIDEVLIDRNNVYYVANKKIRKDPEIAVNGILVLKNSQVYDYKVEGKYLSTKKVDINFIEDKKVYRSKKYKFAGSYYE